MIFEPKRSAGQTGRSASRATIYDVARAAGVSPATVSNALSGRRSVEAETKRKVADAALRLGYSPNARASRLRMGTADAIAIFSSMPFAIAGGRARMGFLMEIAATAAAEALQNGLALMLVPPVAGARPTLTELPFDGAIVVEPLADDPEIAMLRRRGTPVVAIGRQPDSDAPFVDLQSAQSAHLLLEHLWNQGARQIGLIRGAQSRNAQIESERAYCEFALDRRMQARIARAAETGGEAAARAATRDLMTEAPDIDALFVTIDSFAVGAVAGLADLGLRIPEHVMVATRYDGVRARECDPPLTSLNLRLEDVATKAVRLLLAQMNGDAALHTLAADPPQLVARRSTAAPSRAGRAQQPFASDQGVVVDLR